MKKQAFDTKTENGRISIFHILSAAVLITFAPAAGEAAEETKDWANKIAGMTHAKVEKARAEIVEKHGADSKQLKTLEKVVELCNIRPKISNSFNPDRKSVADTAKSEARAKFKGDRITVKEQSILAAIKAIVDKKPEGASPIEVAEKLGVTVNVVNGAVSVLLAKGLVYTERNHAEGEKKAVRRFKLEGDYTTIPVFDPEKEAAERVKAANAARELKKAEKAKADKEKADAKKAEAAAKKDEAKAPAESK